ncbi:MAG: hypothetical protein ABSH22_03130 [Tepidisphaeraceae bacterium]
MRNGAIFAGSVVLGVLLLASPATFSQSRTRSHTGGDVLDSVQPDLKFTDVTLSDAIDFLRDTTQENIVVDWKSLESVNIDKNTLINVRLRDVTLRKALQVILSEASTGDVLTFFVQDNVLQITTQAKADTILFTQVYDVRDLMVTNPQFSPQDVQNVLSSLGSGGGGSQTYGSSTGGVGGATGGGGSQSFSSSSSSAFSSGSSRTQNNTNTDATTGASLVKLITDTIRPEIWKQNGGNSTITFFQGNLIVTAPLSVQEAIGGPVD